MSLRNQQGVMKFGWAGSEGHFPRKKTLKSPYDNVSISGSSCIFVPWQVADQTNIGTSNQDTNMAGYDPMDLGFYPFRGDVFNNADPVADDVGSQDSSSNLQHMIYYAGAPDSRTGVTNNITTEVTGPPPLIGVAHAQQGMMDYFHQISYQAAPLSKSLPQYGMGFQSIQHKDDMGTVKVEATKLPKKAIIQLWAVGGGGGAGATGNATGAGHPGRGGCGAGIKVYIPIEFFYENNQPVDFYLHYYIGAGGAGGFEGRQGGCGGGASFIWWNFNPEANLEDIEYTPNDVTISQTTSSDQVITYLDKPASATRRSSLLLIAGGGGGGGSTMANNQGIAGGMGGSGMGYFNAPNYDGGTGDEADCPPGTGGGSGTGNHSSTPRTYANKNYGVIVTESGSLWNNNSSGGYLLGTSGKNYFGQDGNQAGHDYFKQQNGPGGNLDMPLKWPKRNTWVNRERESLQSGPSPHLWSSRQCVLSNVDHSTWQTGFFIYGAGGGGGYWQGSSGTSVLNFSGLGSSDVIGNGGAAGATRVFHPRLGDLAGNWGSLYGYGYPNTQEIYSNRYDRSMNVPISGAFVMKFEDLFEGDYDTGINFNGNAAGDYGGHGFTNVNGLTDDLAGNNNIPWGSGGSAYTGDEGVRTSANGGTKDGCGRNGLPGQVGFYVYNDGDISGV